MAGMVHVVKLTISRGAELWHCQVTLSNGELVHGRGTYLEAAISDAVTLAVEAAQEPVKQLTLAEGSKTA